jgi:hypothetical protein
MSEKVSPLTLQFLAWIADRTRTYVETMDAWQTTCPRHTVWEDALSDGLIQVEAHGQSQECRVALTPRGRAVLNESNVERERENSGGE